jgi:ribosomal protein S18 acetylase RimI-like enzyme
MNARDVELTGVDLATRLENHWLTCMASAGGGARVLRRAGAAVVVNPRVAGASFNFIHLREADPQRVEELLEVGSAVLQGEGRQPALFLSPAAGEMPALAEALLAAGWRRALRQVVLTSALPATVQELAARAASQVEVAEVGGDGLERWGELLVEAYEVSPLVRRDLQAAWTQMDAGAGAVRYYLACLDGRPAGTGLSWTQGGLTGLYCGAVLPACRRRGVETALVARRLTDGARDGSHLAYLQTEEGSPVVHLCQSRFGFAPAYCRELWLPRHAAGQVCG